MDKHKRSIKIAFPKTNLWMVSTMVLLIVLIVSNFSGLASNPNDTAKKAIDYINNNVVQGGGVSFVSVEDDNGLYKVTTLYQGQKIPIYVTKDGNYVFLSQPASLKPQSTTTTQPAAIPKSGKPTVELFVMSFCPYGIDAEKQMKPVVDLLGSKMDLKVRFIVDVSGNSPESVDSLHGNNESAEDLRQACIANNYDQKTYWNYLSIFGANCSSLYKNGVALGVCWKAAATGIGIDVEKIDACSKSSEAVDLLKADSAASASYNAYSSPTLIINGVGYSGARTSDAFKQAICSAFNDVPSECSQALSSATGSTPSGAC